jgi:hypothetical protein
VKDWFVNLAARDGEPQGPTIPLKVTRSLKGRATSKTINRSVQWTLTADALNLNTVVADASFDRGTAPGTQQTVTLEVNATFLNVLRLPPYGGDKYTVAATKVHGGTQVLTQQYRAFRRLYYLFHYMNDAGKAIYAQVKPELLRIFRDVFIELVEVGKSKIDEQEATSDMEPLVAHAAGLTKKPQQLRLVLTNNFAREEDYEVQLPVEASADDEEEDDDEGAADSVWYEDGAWKFRVHLPPEGALEDHLRRYLPQTLTGKCKLAEYWNHRGTFKRADDLPCEITREGAQVALVTLTDDDDNRILFDHSADGTAEKKTKYAVKITLDAQRNIGGQSDGANIGLTQDMSMYYNDAGQAALALARVFAHEIAHSVGLVMTRGTYNAGVNHPTYYDDAHGGKGKHCFRNAHLVNNTPADAGAYYYPNDAVQQVYVPQNANICIMYHKRTPHLHAGEFCDECKRQLRGADLSATSLTNRRWNDAY